MKLGNRILIIGCCGTGKTHLSKEIEKETNLPLFHLDKIYWKPNWTKPEPQEWENKVRKLINKDKWIIDGNYISTFDLRLRRADTVVLLDFPRIYPLFRILKRFIQSKLFPSKREYLAKGCPPKIDLDLLKYIWSFNKKMRPRIYEKLEGFEGEIVIQRKPTHFSFD